MFLFKEYLARILQLSTFRYGSNAAICIVVESWFSLVINLVRSMCAFLAVQEKYFSFDHIN